MIGTLKKKNTLIIVYVLSYVSFPLFKSLPRGRDETEGGTMKEIDGKGEWVERGIRKRVELVKRSLGYCFSFLFQWVHDVLDCSDA